MCFGDVGNRRSWDVVGEAPATVAINPISARGPKHHCPALDAGVPAWHSTAIPRGQLWDRVSIPA